jgi:DtxR family Mn-dependent transcriptional regulator
MDISRAVEDYLKIIYELQQASGKVNTTALAERLNVAPASVTGMIKKLAEDRPRLVNYERHHGVSLTPAGQKIALEVIRHHRLLELYLHQALGYSWDEVDAEAEKLEHVISEGFEDRIATLLGQPELDPHGAPIPTKEGTVAPLAGARLSQMEVGQQGRVVRVCDDDPALLRYLAELGIRPETAIAVVGRSPFDGPMHVRVGNRSPQALGKHVTDHVFVEVK